MVQQCANFAVKCHTELRSEQLSKCANRRSEIHRRTGVRYSAAPPPDRNGQQKGKIFINFQMCQVRIESFASYHERPGSTNRVRTTNNAVLFIERQRSVRTLSATLILRRCSRRLRPSGGCSSSCSCSSSRCGSCSSRGSRSSSGCSRSSSGCSRSSSGCSRASSRLGSSHRRLSLRNDWLGTWVNQKCLVANDDDL